MWGSLPLIAPNFLEGWWDMRRLSLCCSIVLDVVFDPRSHTHYPPYELMNRNWYVSFCWAWYQEKSGPCRSIPDEKSKTIPVPGGAVLSSFRIESHLCPGLKLRDSESPSPYQFLLYAWFSIHRLVLFRWTIWRCELLTSIFFKDFLISQNQDGQPTVILRM
jgi:hypothetical protein